MPSLSRGVDAVKKWWIGHIKLTMLAFLFGIFFAVITVIGKAFEIPMIYFVILFGFLYRLLHFKNLHWMYRLMITLAVFIGVAMLFGEEERSTLKDAFEKQFSRWTHISMFSFYILFGTFLYAYLV